MSFTIEPPTPTVSRPSPRAREVAQLFDLQAPARRSRRRTPALVPTPTAGQIMLLVGPSGGGKSSLLRELSDRFPGKALDLASIRPSDVPCCDAFGETIPLASALKKLGRVGLAEAWTYLRRPRHLSDGQRWRLKLALAMHRAVRLSVQTGPTRQPVVLVADEFAALLDRVTAAVVARCLRNTIDRHARVGVPICAIVATSHDDLEPALAPDLIARCTFAKVEIVRHEPRS